MIEIDDVVTGFTSTNDYAVLTLGQLKHVAQPFYDRLSIPVSWTDTSVDDTDYAIATLGQLKNVFSLDPARDLDGDGLPDWWEWSYFGALEQGPDDDPDGDGLSNTQEFSYCTSPLYLPTIIDNIADTYVIKNDAGNGSLDPEIHVERTNDGSNVSVWRGFIRFDISPFENVKLCRLLFTASNHAASATTQVKIYPTENEKEWDETTINFNNRPYPPGPKIGNAYVSGVSSSFVLNATSAIQIKLNDGETYATFSFRAQENHPRAYIEANLGSITNRGPKLWIHE